MKGRFIEEVPNLAVKFKELGDIRSQYGKLSLKEELSLLAQLFVSKVGHRLWYKDNRWMYHNGVFVEEVTEAAVRWTIAKCLQPLTTRLIKTNAGNKDTLYKNIFEMCSDLGVERSILPDSTGINLKSNVLEVTKDGVQFRDRTIKDQFTYVLSYDYDESASCPMFENFLNTVVPAPQYRAVLQEYIGACLMSPKHLPLEKMLLLKGSGSNGKSTFINIVTALFGKQNVATESFRTLTIPNNTNTRNVIGKLVCVDTEFEGVVSEGEFKKLVSGEPVSIKELYKQPYPSDDLPRFLLACNDLPPNLGLSSAMKRRLLIIPFDVQIDKPDRYLAHKIISSELPGILRWAIEGLKRILERPMPDIFIPEEVKSYTEELSREHDAVVSFVGDCNIQKSKDANDFVSIRKLYGDFVSYCHDSNFKVPNINTFSRRLKNLGFEAFRTSNQRGFLCKNLSL